jgi:murein DD-endopeptidase MepM/ murein hydrolase activator NlpD
VVTSAVVGAGMVALGTAAAMPSQSHDNGALSSNDPTLDPSSTGGYDDDRGQLADRGSRSGRSATLPNGKTQAPQDVWVLPVKKYDVSSLFAPRWGTFHYGVDMANDTGTPVYAAHAGVVTRAGWYGGYGYVVEIDHGNGLITRYGHNSEVLVHVGEQVSTGQQVSRMGSTGQSTGPHCHFEVRINDKPVNPVPFMIDRDVDIMGHQDSPYADQV